MKILILTQYFPPETGAPQNRLSSLANHLTDFGNQVSILTAMPNYPKMEVFEKYKGLFYKYENEESIAIHRAWIYVKKSRNIVSRLFNYFSFVFSSLIVGLIKIEKQDIIICESPPLFLGITALLLKFFKGSKLVFNVSDLWPESAEKLNIVNNKFLLGISYKLENLIYKKSDLVSGQTQGIVDSINNRFPKVQTYLYRNGIDLRQFNLEGNRNTFREKYRINEFDFVVTYAGIIGHAQGLEVIINAAQKLLSIPQIKFHIIGDGPEKNKLVNLATQLKTSNVIFTDSLSRSEMVNVVSACDVYVAPLRKNDLFLGAIPSKIFEPLAYKKPVLLGVDGEAYNLFVKEGKCALHFIPENADDLALKAKELFENRLLREELGENGYNYVRKNFDRSILANNFWGKLQTI